MRKQFFLFLSIVLFATVFVVATPARADTTVSGTISEDTTWPLASSTIIVDGTITINSGVTLTVDPGVVVKFDSTDGNIRVLGTLDALGTSTAPIYFTSYHDDDVGGDTNGNGTSTSPTGGDWKHVEVESGGTASFEYATIRYAGSTWSSPDRYTNIYIDGGGLTLATSTVSHAATYGVRQANGTTTFSNATISDQSYGFWIANGVATIASSTMRDNTSRGLYATNGTLNFTDNDFIDNDYAVYIAGPDLLGTHSSNTATSTVSTPYNGIFITGTQSSDNTWTTDDMPYVFDDITINSGATLAVDAGVVAKGADASSKFIVNGTFDVNGTIESPVYITSIKDDDADGHDTNGDGASSGSAGDWKEIEINSGGTADLEHATIRYGGSTWGSPDRLANVNVDGGELTLATSTLSHANLYNIWLSNGTTTATSTTLSNSNYGLYLSNGTATFASSTIRDHTGRGLYAGNGVLNFTDNDFIDNDYAVYLAGPDLLGTHSGNTATSTVSTPYNGIFITGTLNNDSTWTSDTMPYIFDNITINSSTTLTVDSGVIAKAFDGGSYITVNGTLDVNGSSLYPAYFTSLKDDSADGHDTNGDGDSASPSSGDWKQIEITSTGSADISFAKLLYGGSNVCCSQSRANFYNTGGELAIATSTIAYGDIYGLYQSSGTTTIFQSVIRDNTSYGAYNANGATTTFLATNNFWNATSGPYQVKYNATGTGETLSDYIGFNPWLGQEHYTLGFDSVDNTGGYHIQWEWAASTTQEYANEWAVASTTWSALGAVDIKPYESGINDLVISEVNDSEVKWVGLYDHDVLSADEIYLNRYYVDTYPRVVAQNVWTHELGHALGLDHSYWENTLYPQVTKQTSLGPQDIGDYNYCWVDDNC